MFVWLAVGSFAFADVRLSFHDGQVSIVAKDATIGQILAEWAKIGQTKIVNGERIPGPAVTIELENVSEQRALDVVLRELSGYMAAPRAVAVPNASRFDRIIVVPTSVRPARAAAAAAKASATPAYQEYPQQESAYQAAASPRQSPTYQAPAYAQQQSASQAAASPRQPPAYQASAYSQPPPPPPDDTANDGTEEPLSVSVGVAISTQESGGPVANPRRQALETVDPRTFRLEVQQPQTGLPMVPPSGGMLRGGGVAVPGMIVQPKPQPR
jgi:hypothetical protein